MKNPFKHQSQFELFPGTPGAKPKKVKSSIFGRSLTLSFENIVSVGVVFLMGMVVAFSFGVEKGKKSAAAKYANDLATSEMVQYVRSENMVLASEIPKPESDIIMPDYVEKISIEPEIEKNIVVSEKKVDKTPSLEKIHTIQVASFKQKSMAESEASRLKETSYDAFVEKKGSYYIVCVGQFEERYEATPLLKGLRKRYSDCYIRSL